MCTQSSSDAQISNNIYHLFLKYLFLNLKDNRNTLNPAHSSSTITSSLNTTLSSGSTTTTTSGGSLLVWRQFKGRLYTRLHDKRITELDVAGLINVCYLFFTLIKSFSTSTSPSPNVSQLKFEQCENFYRILNVFARSKNLNKIDHVLSLSAASNAASSISMSSVAQAKINALKVISTMKFVALRLCFETTESLLINDDSNELENLNNEDLDSLIKLEFADSFNCWLDDALEIVNKCEVAKESAVVHKETSGQISRYLPAQRYIFKYFRSFLM